MKDGACSPDIGVYFLDIISSMERIAGYAFTIARYILSRMMKKNKEKFFIIVPKKRDKIW